MIAIPATIRLPATIKGTLLISPSSVEITPFSVSRKRYVPPAVKIIPEETLNPFFFGKQY